MATLVGATKPLTVSYFSGDDGDEVEFQLQTSDSNHYKTLPIYLKPKVAEEEEWVSNLPKARRY